MERGRASAGQYRRAWLAPTDSSASSTAGPTGRLARKTRSSTETRKKKSELDHRRLEAEAAGGGAGGVDAGRSRVLSEPTDVHNHEGGHHLHGAVRPDPDQPP